MITFSNFDKKHLRNLARSQKVIDDIYIQALNEGIMASVNTGYKSDSGKEFSFANYPMASKRIDNAVATFASKLETIITEGNQREWMLATAKNGKVIDQLTKKSKVDKAVIEKWKSPNLEALEAFQKRKNGKGMNLSNQVWQIGKQLRGNLEMAIEVGMGDGKSAAAMTKDVKQYLNNPNALFRRVRDKKGALRLSKNAKAYHPGQGVYRSAYKNALRLTATENNMAYRESDHDQWQRMDFVVGYEVHLSNNHTLNGKPHKDICDVLQGRYPKTFRFKGWHPFCRCFATPILADWDEQLKVMKMQKEGKDVSNYHYKGEVTDVPDGFKEWISDNEERIYKASNVPYFIQDNFIDGDINKGYEWQSAEYLHAQQLQATAERQANRTQEQIADIKQRWEERNSKLANAENVAKKAITMAENYPHDVDTTEIQRLLDAGQYYQAESLADNISKRIASLNADIQDMADIFPNAQNLAKDYSIDYLYENAKAMRANVAMCNGKTLKEQESILSTLEANSPDIQKPYYSNKLKEVRIDIKLDDMRIDIDNVVAYSRGTSIQSFANMTDELKAAVKMRDVAKAESLLKSSTRMRILVDRYDEVKAYNTKGKSFPLLVEEARKQLESGDLTAALKAIKDAEDEMERLEARRLYLQAKAAQKKAEEEAKRKAEEEAAKKKAEEPKKPLADCTFDELNEQLGAGMPRLLQNYEKSVKRLQWTHDEYKNDAKEIEHKFKDFFAGCDFAHRTKCTMEQIAANGIITNLQATQMGFGKGAWYDDDRRAYGHFAYGLQDDQKRVSKKQFLKDGEYYRCGTPCSKNMYKGYCDNTAKGYGMTQVLFRKDRVITTFTFGNSLSTHRIPSLVGDPKVCSIDSGYMKNYKDKKYDSNNVHHVHEGCEYIELQYMPVNGSENITLRDMKAVILPDKASISTDKALLKKFYDAGTDIYYIDHAKKQCVLFQKGKPLMSVQEAAKLRHAQRDAELKKAGVTKEEQIQKLLQERAENIAKANKEASTFLKDTSAYENKDTEALLIKAKERLKAGNSVGAYTLVQEVQKQHNLFALKYNMLKANIPNVVELHKKFTFSELEAANKAINDKLQYIEAKAAGSLAKMRDKLDFEVKYIEKPANQKYATWEIARDAYKRKLAEVVYKIKGEETLNAINSAETYKTRSVKYKNLLQKAKDLHTDGKYDDAQSILAQAEELREQLESKNAIVKAVKFANEAFSKAEKDGALWYKNENNPQLSFNEVDAIMSKYAEDVWKRLTAEERHVAYLYTSGSRYINEPFFTTYGAVKRSPVDGSIRSSVKDINTLTEIIDKCKPLEQAMWVQHAEDIMAFSKRFGVNLWAMSDPSKLVGLEAVNAPFMSTSCAKFSYFTKQDIRGDMNVVMSLYLPKGTKGMYVEPFAHYGDGKLYGDETSRYGSNGANWNGKSRQDAGKAAGDQVEFLLQRGAKIKITKAEYKDGRWYIDAELIEQTALKAFK